MPVCGSFWCRWPIPGDGSATCATTATTATRRASSSVARPRKRTCSRRCFAAERCNLFIDLHEDRFHEGFYLLAYAEPAASDLGALVRSIEADSQVQHARRGDRGLFLIGEAELDSLSKTTAASWARRNGSSHAIIVETHDGMPLEQRVSLHLMAIDRLTRLLLPR